MRIAQSPEIDISSLGNPQKLHLIFNSLLKDVEKVVNAAMENDSNGKVSIGWFSICDKSINPRGNMGFIDAVFSLKSERPVVTNLPSPVITSKMELEKVLTE